MPGWNGPDGTQTIKQFLRDKLNADVSHLYEICEVWNPAMLWILHVWKTRLGQCLVINLEHCRIHEPMPLYTQQQPPVLWKLSLMLLDLHHGRPHLQCKIRQRLDYKRASSIQHRSNCTVTTKPSSLLVVVISGVSTWPKFGDRWKR